MHAQPLPWENAVSRRCSIAITSLPVGDEVWHNPAGLPPLAFAAMDFRDTEELAAFRAEARAWLSRQAPPRSHDDRVVTLFDRRVDSPQFLERARAWQARLCQAGWAGLTWPTEHGGRGLTPLHEIVWNQEAAAYALPTHIFGIGLGMAGPTIIAWGTDEQRRRWLPPLLSGEEIWCQLFSEPAAGSDVAGLRTRAIPDGDEWVVNGQKAWTSGAQYSKWGMLLARTDPQVPKHRGLTYFVIDLEQPGVEVRPLRQMTGGANFNEVFFTDARVSDANVVGGVGNGWSVAVTTLLNERLSIGAVGSLGGSGVFGTVRRMLDEVGRRTGRHPLTSAVARHRLVDVYVGGEVLRYLSQRLISKLARGEIPTAEGATAKLSLTSLVSRLADFVIDAQGPGGALAGVDATSAGQWTQFFLGAPGLRIAGGTDEIMRNIIGERVLGLPPEPRVDKNRPFAELA